MPDTRRAALYDSTPSRSDARAIHKSLEARDLLPTEHLVDKGYTDAGVLIDSQRDYAVAVIGPVADDPSWQARADAGFDKSHFVVDWDRQRVTCPAGKRSISWLPKTNPKSVILVEARFSGRDCTPCPLRSRCTRSKHEPRIIGLQAREYHEALQAARKRQDTAEFRESYAARAGIEATTDRLFADAPCGAVAISGWPKHTCSISSALPPSTWCGSPTG